jgi:hypothetical protein
MAEIYLDRLRPDAEAQRSEFTATVLLDFERIILFLSLRPYPQPGSDLVRAELDAERTYSYADARFPFAVEYRVFEPESGSEGLVVVTRFSAKP